MKKKHIENLNINAAMFVASYCQFRCETIGFWMKIKHYNATIWNLLYLKKERLFYSSAMALIMPQLKYIANFVFISEHKKAKILPLWSLSTLCLYVCLSVCCYVCLSFGWYVCPYKCHTAYWFCFKGLVGRQGSH